MSKLILRTNDGQEILIKEVKSISKADHAIVLFLTSYMRPEDIEIMESEMAKSFEKKVILLDAKFKDKMFSV
ncbi:hypothetical protein [Acetobacterium sp.]|uniref:hypothetical protein n=1 Tax=Acetobacterium sp. TaxID=1872094 RepID=UPI002F3FE5B5